MTSFFKLPMLLLVAALSYLVLIWLGTNSVGTPMGDLTFAYQPWADQVLKQNVLLGISSAWVYPFPALIPILAAAMIAPDNFMFGWLALRVVSLLALLTILVTVGLKRESSPSVVTRYISAYAFVGFTFALGPVSLSRIDSYSVSLAVLGALLLALNSPKASAALFTFAAWIKIWPIAMFAPLIYPKRSRLRVLGIGAGISLGLIALGLVFGGNLSIFSFATGQLQRGLQIESPAAMPWLWSAVFGANDSGINYNQTLLTFEVFGGGVELVSALLGLVQLGAILITFTLGWLASSKNALSEVLTWTSLTGVCDLIFFNKVGSPQFISWLAVPIILGLLLEAERIRLGAALVLTTTLCTWLVYPIFYDDILASGFFGTALLTIRNLLELALLVYANFRLTALATRKS